MLSERFFFSFSNLTLFFYNFSASWRQGRVTVVSEMLCVCIHSQRPVGSRRDLSLSCVQEGSEEHSNKCLLLEFALPLVYLSEGHCI